MADPLIGKQVGQYEIISLIGYGGMAAVYVAFQRGMKRNVALKLLSNVLTKDANFVARFEREVELAASLEHAHIVPVYEYGMTDDGMTYLTMRYVTGGTLAERIKQGPMLLETVSSILQQIAGALDYAHERGVIHRDIKPSNVLLDEQGNAYLADFGLALMVDPTQRNNLTQTGTLVGTPTYIAPEQALEAKSETRSDLYSLGVVVYEMVTGRPPFTGDSMFSIMQAHVADPPPPAQKYRPDLPDALDMILEKALSKKPDERYQRATDFAREFAQAMQSTQITPPRLTISQTIKMPSTVITAPRIQSRNARLFTAGLLLVLLTTLGFLVVPGLIAPVATPTPTISPTATLPPFADESLRPNIGVPDDLILTDAEIALAHLRMQGSFIGIMACTLETEFHASLIRSARTRASALGFQVRVEDSRADRFRQPAIINQFIAQDARAIFICPLDDELLEPAVRAAQDAGIVTVNIGDRVFGKASIAFTLTNETMGRKVGEYAAELINREREGQANVIILDYPSLPHIVLRADAMEAALREDAPGARILGRYQGGLADNGEQSMTIALARHSDIHVIMSINDAGAFGAAKALRAAGIASDHVAIISVDAEAEARRMIREGEYFRASLDNDPVGSARLMIDGIVKVLAGSVVPRQVLMPGQMITRETLRATPTAT